jgi:redox-sensitive bicupin YhaK (pirin superfamily)
MNNKYKSIKALLSPPPFHMVGDGFRVHNFFPSLEEPGLTGMSPFFLMDYNSKWDLPPSDRQKGVGVHPHRGFETVSISYHGSIAHHDSAGNSGIIHKGDVQWMTAGSGVLHKEYHEKEFSKKGGLFQMVQLWVNLPAKFKMTPARYQAIENSDMGKFILPDSKSHLDIIAGEYEGVKGPAFTFTPMNVFNAYLEEKATVEFSFHETYNTGLLIVEGSVQVNESTGANENYFVYLGRKGNLIKLKANSKSTILVLSGEPINEPIAAQGPFVMNTNDEIRRAYEDFYSGKFGHLEG